MGRHAGSLVVPLVNDQNSGMPPHRPAARYLAE
jgi:hypothetical protein